MTLELLEFDWDAVSRYLTPLTLKSALSKASKSSLESFQRCRTQVFCNMFTSLQIALHQKFPVDPEENPLKRSLRIVSYLCDHGFIPLIPPGSVSNSTFSLQDEWNTTPNVEIMRRYWDAMLENVKKTDVFNCIFQFIIQQLPGCEGIACESCQWKVPQSAMWNSKTCSYCHRIETCPLAKLKMSYDGVPFMHIPFRPKKI
jgi:hypothetical protein